MKLLIWIGCTILGSITGGITLGLTTILAMKLCAKWDIYKAKRKAESMGMTMSEYGRYGLSEKFIAKLEEMCNTIPYEQVKTQLKACLKSGKITKHQYIILLNEYSTVK